MGVEIQEDLQQELSKSFDTFEAGEDLLQDAKTAELLLGSFYVHCGILQTLKVVEYIGPDSKIACRAFNTVHVKVLVYKLFDNEEERDYIEQAEVTSMPHVNYDGKWDE